MDQMKNKFATAAAALLVASPCLAVIHVEDFSAPRGDCSTDPVFNHQFSGTTSIVLETPGYCHLELSGGEDFITFNLPRGYQVVKATVMMYSGCDLGSASCPTAVFDGTVGSITASVDPGYTGAVMFGTVGFGIGAVESIHLSSADFSHWDSVFILAINPDFNDDDVVNGLDLAILLSAWGPCPPGSPAPPCEADLTGDNVVDGADLANLLALWGPVD
jgi:hypothetical protein